MMAVPVKLVPKVQKVIAELAGQAGPGIIKPRMD